MKIHNSADVKSWLERIDEDVKWVEYDFRGGFYRWVCFGCQQIAEKSLKTYIYSLKEDFKPVELKELHTHNLSNLADIIKKYGGIIKPELISKLTVLNLYYMPTRYADIPNPIGNFSLSLAQEAINFAKEIYDFVKNKLTTR